MHVCSRDRRSSLFQLCHTPLEECVLCVYYTWSSAHTHIHTHYVVKCTYTWSSAHTYIHKHTPYTGTQTLTYHTHSHIIGPEGTQTLTLHTRTHISLDLRAHRRLRFTNTHISLDLRAHRVSGAACHPPLLQTKQSFGPPVDVKRTCAHKINRHTYLFNMNARAHIHTHTTHTHTHTHKHKHTTHTNTNTHIHTLRLQ